MNKFVFYLHRNNIDFSKILIFKLFNKVHKDLIFKKIHEDLYIKNCAKYYVFLKFRLNEKWRKTAHNPFTLIVSITLSFK